MFASAHEFAELRLLSSLRSRAVRLPPDLRDEAERLVGGSGSRIATRLDLDPEADEGVCRTAAGAALARWRRRAASPLADRATADACGVVVRSCEGMLASLG